MIAGDAPPVASTELRSRSLVAVVAIPLALGAIYSGGWVLTLLITAVAAVAAWECYGLADSSGARPFRWLGVPAAMAIVVLAGRQPVLSPWAGHAFVVLLLLGITSLVATVTARRIEEALFSLSATVFGALYTGGTLSFVILIRGLPEARGEASSYAIEGFLLVLLPLLVTWAGDTAAYFVGKKLGRRRLAPRTSPGKTVEGGIAGLAASLLAGLCLGFFLDDYANFPISPATGALFGLCLGAAGQLGDLAESRMKREAGVKDSGRLLAGHGGILDRFDALFIAFPLAYGLIVLSGILT